MKNLMISTLPILFGSSNREEWDGRASSAYEGEEWRIQSFGGETWA